MSIGDIAEQRIIDIFTPISTKVEKNIDRATRSHYDIEVVWTMIDGGAMVFTIEVKNDVYALKSGNIAVEMYNPKSAKESGLTATKADLWVFMVGDELWIANTQKLKEHVDKNKPFRIIDSGGDNNAYIYLYKKDILFPVVFHQINGLTSEQLEKKIREIL